jgi:hypothetical protein
MAQKMPTGRTSRELRVAGCELDNSQPANTKYRDTEPDLSGGDAKV